MCSPGVFGGDAGGGVASLRALQRARRQLHLEARGHPAPHGPHPGGERGPGRGPRHGPLPAGPGPLHPRHLPVLQRRPHRAVTLGGYYGLYAAKSDEGLNGIKVHGWCYRETVFIIGFIMVWMCLL